MVADIEKAFLQISLQPSDRDATRFLWFKDPQKLSVDDGNIEVLRFARVPFGAICSPFLLGGVVQHHLRTIDTEVARMINDNIYVDNVIAGVTDDAKGEAFYAEAKHIFVTAGMNLREWCSNSDELLQSIPPHDRTKGRDVKVLGIKWNSLLDELKLQSSWTERSNCRTKREVLQATASIYDPLGLFQPVTLQAKCFLRELWDNKSGWDDPLSEDLLTKWRGLHRDILPVFDIAIPRLINPSDEVCLVCFADASGDAYATAIYLRSNADNRWETNLIFAKSRLSPRRTSPTISLPRLELLGLTIAAKATKFVRRSLSSFQSLKAYMMTDSSCVLGWLKSIKTLPVFVSNRIKTIRALENVEFHHVVSKDNAADIATRGLPGSEISESELWWHGPKWLQKNCSDWPTSDTFDVVSSEELQTLRSESSTTPPIYHTLVSAVTEGTTPFNIDPSKYSSWRRLLRVTAQCLKAVNILLWNNLTVKTRSAHPRLDRLFGEPVGEYIMTLDISNAKQLWVRQTQQSNFADVVAALRSTKRHQLIKRLNVQCDQDDFLRCSGRLDNADLPVDAIRPLLLPKNSSVTDLIIADAHDTLFHAGISHTLNHIRRQFWIPQGRNAVRKVITRCGWCRKLKGPPFALPQMPQLPRERVSKSKPFQFSGVDYMGPIHVSLHGVTRKMWVCLFTCLSVRAVHLEHVSDCSAQCFIDCISRFIARRGCPEQIISDNAPQFRLANILFNKTWPEMFNDESVQSYVSGKGVSWKHINELSPWQGGFYERLVGVVKGMFKSAVGRKLLAWDQFVTLVTEIEAIVNSRPLTYVCSDINSGLALRPSDFLSAPLTGTPCIDATARPEGGDAGKNLMRYWKYKQRRLDHVWTQWYDNYLLSLREKQRMDHRQGRSNLRDYPRLDEVVLVRNTDAPRGSWKLGKIVAVIRGRDDAVRSADVRLPNQVTIRRSISHLYRLEVPCTEGERQETDDDFVTDDDAAAAERADGANDAPLGDGDIVDGASEKSVKDTQIPTSNHNGKPRDTMLNHNGVTTEAVDDGYDDDDEPFHGFDADEVNFNLLDDTHHDMNNLVSFASGNIWDNLSDRAVMRRL